MHDVGQEVVLGLNQLLRQSSFAGSSVGIADVDFFDTNL